MLEAAEREAVCGDLNEAAGTSLEGLREVLGLVARRQAQLWLGWRPWLCLAIVLPLGILLSVVSHRISSGNAVTLWLTANNVDAYLLRNEGFWSGVRDSVPGVFLAWLAIGCWSWTCGFAAGVLSRRAVLSTGAIFCVVLLACAVPGVLSAMDYKPAFIRADLYHVNDAVFRLAFYRWMLPLFVQIALVLIPVLRGMCDGTRSSFIPRALKIVMWLSVSLTVFSLVTQGMFWWMVRVWMMYPLRYPLLPSLLPFAMLGPMAYLLSLTTQQRKKVSTR
ncbi:hypothetical protein GRAN_2555 [Granulicella sibirica]|uniref:Uncharacterized protein n=2 Tax=Granulicella sibirica TaxID=2479048 RepID=A0A4Q0T166_9BACT|nr:hypothetical protein GRAN_2555 [Granulicella sibirica]